MLRLLPLIFFAKAPCRRQDAHLFKRLPNVSLIRFIPGQLYTSLICLRRKALIIIGVTQSVGNVFRLFVLQFCDSDTVLNLWPPVKSVIIHQGLTTQWTQRLTKVRNSYFLSPHWLLGLTYAICSSDRQVKLVQSFIPVHSCVGAHLACLLVYCKVGRWGTSRRWSQGIGYSTKGTSILICGWDLKDRTYRFMWHKRFRRHPTNKPTGTQPPNVLSI